MFLKGWDSWSRSSVSGIDSNWSWDWKPGSEARGWGKKPEVRNHVVKKGLGRDQVRLNTGGKD